MVSRNYRPSTEKSSIGLNRETSSTSVSETQPEHGVEGLENVVLHNEDESRHKGKVKWGKEATILLISGWFNTSKDAIVGNDQTSTHFWARIAEYNNTNQKGEQARTGSGWSDEQILENAHQLYKSENNNSNFLLVDCWRLLKDEPKWNTMYQPKGGQRTKVLESGAFTSCSNADISDDDGSCRGHQRLFDDYFSDEPVYTEYQFRRRFRMRRHVFLRIVQALENHSEYFHTRFDVVGRRGLSPLQKCTAAMRMLAYGAPADYVDEYVRIGETTAIECLVNFVRGVNDIFRTEYLRRLNAGDIHRLLQMGEVRGFPTMLGSIDCMHWEWKNCPVAWKCQFTRGDHGRPTIMLEAVVSQDLWIWHAFFGVPGSNNDLNVLNQSPIFTDILQGQAPRVEFTINVTQYNKGYYIADGIYPVWGTFVKNIPVPQGEKRKLFAQCKEAVCSSFYWVCSTWMSMQIKKMMNNGFVF
ncbi:uncharacterized protein LOC133795323 [Humulus lupulus]|uniref:uncharacterized protein LOC133795323 n=1 Tax=Humulus lupulus TaxID=3486 RepID=UPI002B413261|nr:uncharacterized protein LOC133795323 [Humulus lupulus]